MSTVEQLSHHIICLCVCVCVAGREEEAQKGEETHAEWRSDWDGYLPTGRAEDTTMVEWKQQKMNKR